MSEKFILRFSPSETERPITSVSISADEKYGEVISYSALDLSEQLTKKLEELSEMVRKKNTGTYDYAVSICKELSAELGEDFEIIPILEKLDPAHKNRYAACSIRPLPPDGFFLLDGFLYDAIFIPEGVEPPPRDILKQPELQVYTEKFGTRKGDAALAAVLNDKIVGMAWARIMNDYGHIDNETPSIAISVKKNYRGGGIGMQLMVNLIMVLCGMGFKRVSLAVQRENHPAVKLYIKLGFKVLCIKGDEYLMVFDLKKIKE